MIKNITIKTLPSTLSGPHHPALRNLVSEISQVNAKKEKKTYVLDILQPLRYMFEGVLSCDIIH